MRLTEAEVASIIESVESCLDSKKAELRLFGSRVNDKKKGGDIDLLLILADQEVKADFNEIALKIDLLVAIKSKIGDQKIDLVIADQKKLQEDCFVQLIYPESKILKKW